MWLPGRVIDALNMEVEEVNLNGGVNANPRVRFGSGMLTEQGTFNLINLIFVIFFKIFLVKIG